MPHPGMTSTDTDRPSHGAEHAASMSIAAEKRQRGRDIRPLRRLLPYLTRRRVDLAGAAIFLLLAAAASLAVPRSEERRVGKGCRSRCRCKYWYGSRPMAETDR